MMQSLIDALASFNKYLMMENEDAADYFDSEEASKIKIDLNLFKKTPITNECLRDIVQEILESLDIPKEQWGRYLGVDLSVYDFLAELCQRNKKNNERIAAFIDFVDEHAMFHWKKLFYPATFLFSAAQLCVAYLSILGKLTIVQAVLASVFFAPIVGAIYTSAVAIYSLYKHFHDKKTPLFHRIQDNLFLLAHVGLKYAGYGLLIAAAAAMGPMTAILFVAAEVVLALREIASLVRMVINKQHSIIIPEYVNLDSSLVAQQHQARHELEYANRRNAKLINIATAVILVGMVAVSVFVPGGIFVTVGAIAAIITISFIKKQILNHNEEKMHKRLESKFEALEQEHIKKQALTADNQLTDAVVNDNSVSEQAPVEVAPTIQPPVVRLAQKSDDRTSLPSRAGMFADRGKKPTPPAPAESLESAAAAPDDNEEGLKATTSSYSASA